MELLAGNLPSIGHPSIRSEPASTCGSPTVAPPFYNITPVNRKMKVKN
jgi:hypothetical protein